MASRSSYRVIAKVAFSVICVIVLTIILLFSFFIYKERNEPYWSRLYLTKSEIDIISSAAESFRNENGNYPQHIEELVGQLDNGKKDRRYLKMLPSNPWGGKFFYEVRQHGATQNFKIWTIPDQKTQDESGVTELSNETDWNLILSH